MKNKDFIVTITKDLKIKAIVMSKNFIMSSISSLLGSWIFVIDQKNQKSGLKDYKEERPLLSFEKRTPS